MELVCTIDLLDKNPMTLFNAWFQEAMQIYPDGRAAVFSLATCSSDGRPSLRNMYLRGQSAEGFKIYTDMSSQKGRDLEENPVCSAAFYWVSKDDDNIYQAKQVRIFGRASKLPRSECQNYFDSEPWSSKIRASFPQSQPAASPEAILGYAENLEKEYMEKKDQIPAPSRWGGYLIQPEEMEFYFGRRDTINQRVRFRKSNKVADGELVHCGAKGWVYEYLFP